MLAALQIVSPIFALIFVGWLAGKTAILGPHATAEINRFVVWLALPALLFNVIAGSDWSDLWQPDFIVVYTASAALSMAAGLAVSLWRNRHLADAAIEGLNAGYANIGFVGFPIVLLALGADALVPATIGSIVTMCVIFATAIVLVEAGLQAERQPLRLVLKVGATLIRNPILVASATAFVFPVTGLVVPAPAKTFLTLLGNAAAPCALVALGLFLAAPNQANSRVSHAMTVFLFLCKLVLQPALAWLLAVHVFGLSSFATLAAVLLAALPAGTGSFMLAELYKRDPQVSSHVIIFSTLASTVTLAIILAVMA